MGFWAPVRDDGLVRILDEGRRGQLPYKAMIVGPMGEDKPIVLVVVFPDGFSH